MSRGFGRWPDNFREESSACGQVVETCRGTLEERPEVKCASSAGLMLTPSMSAVPEHPSFVKFLLTSCCFFCFFKCIHHLALTFKTRMSPLPPAVFFMQHDWGASLKSLNTKLPYITCTDNATVLQSHCYRGRLCVQLELTDSLCDILHVLCVIKPPQPPFFNTTWASPHTREHIQQADVVLCLLRILKISGNPFRLIWCLHKQNGLHGRRQHKHSSWSKCLLLGLFAQEVVRGKKDGTDCLLKHWPNMCLNYQTDSISKRPQFEVVDALLYS